MLTAPTIREVTATWELSAATAGDRPRLERLWQLYRHDLSEFRDSHPDADGLFKQGPLEAFLAGDPDRIAYLFLQDGRPLGFALIGGVEQEPHRVDDFFVVRSVRRTGVGRKAAERLLAAHPGAWRIGFQNENPKAARFWRLLAADLGADVQETLQPVPGKPHIPHDVILTFTVGG